MTSITSATSAAVRAWLEPDETPPDEHKAPEGPDLNSGLLAPHQTAR